jgi:hypothetical protein
MVDGLEEMERRTNFSILARNVSIREGIGNPTVEFLARLLQHVPEPRLRQVRYYGYYSNVVRARRAESEDGAEIAREAEAPAPGAAERRRLRRSWAQLIRRIYEVDPLTCIECGGEMRILAFLLDPAVVRKILAHLAERRGRAPPPVAAPAAS